MNLNPRDNHRISLKYWNGSFTAQFCCQGYYGNDIYLPCNNAEMEFAFKEMYQFMHSKKDTETICGCRVTKIIAKKSGNPYFHVNLNFIRYKVFHSLKSESDTILVYIDLPFESPKTDKEDSQ